MNRYDQDNPLGSQWTMRYRTNAAALDFDANSESAQAIAAMPKIQEMLDAGVVSGCTASWSYRPNTVRIHETTEWIR